jgi:CobQ-like glutamine amidotransferase family enzyme
MSALRVCSLYPELMNIYADRGNIAVLRARCEWRGIGFELGAASMREPVDPDAWDLLYMGGGQDRDQAAVAVDMVETKRDALHAAAARGCSPCAAAISSSGTATRWVTRSCRESASWTCAPCANRARG